MQYGGCTSPLSRKLSGLALKVAAEEHKKEQEARRLEANKVDGRIGRRIKFSDDEIREMRRLHEVDGKKAREIAERFGATRPWVEKVLAYDLRSRHIL